MSGEKLAQLEGPDQRQVRLAIALPLHAAIALNRPELCLGLLEREIDPEVKNSRKQTAWRNAELNAPQCQAVMLAWRTRQAMADLRRAAPALVTQPRA